MSVKTCGVLVAARAMEARTLAERADGAQGLGSYSVRYQFIDCRWELGNPSRGRELYLGGHIPGASFLDVDEDLAGPPGREGRHPLPDARQFARAAARAGAGDGVFVVAYGNMGGPERLWWLLRHFGHEDCAVVDFEAWRGPLATGEELVEPVELTVRPREDDVSEGDELAARLAQHAAARAPTPRRYPAVPNPT